MKKTRVLVVNTANMGFTGITSVIMNYVRNTFNDVNYDFVICGRLENDIADELVTLGNEIMIPPYSRLRNPLAYYSWLKGIVKRNKYDVIHVHGNSGTMYIEIHAAKKMGIPVRITHCHSTSCKYKLAHYVLKPFMNIELTQAIACSELAGKWLYTRSFHVLPNGIDVQNFMFSKTIRKEYREKLGINDKFVIGHVANMTYEKNHMFLLRVFKALAEENPNMILMLVGDGMLRGSIEAYISENDLEDNVLLLGRRSDVAQLYQCMDIFVLPSLFEGLPVTLVEAQCSGLPCIVSDHITREVDVTNNITHIGIQESDISKWKETIINSIDNVDLIGRNKGAEILSKSRFSIKHCVDELLEIYKYN